jgi:hypothetical protein
MLNVDTFRVLCQLVAEEKDPSKLELLRERMKLLLADRDRTTECSPEAFVN